MNKEYKIKLDLNKRLYNKKMSFNQFDENVNDFYIEVTKNNEIIQVLDKSIVTLVAIKPDGTVDAQFIEAKEGQIYAELKPSMCDLVGNYQAKAMIVLEEEIVTTDTISYSVNEDKIISRLNDDIVSDERYVFLTDALARLSTIEISEEQRIVNEAERILEEENRRIEEAKRVEAELIRVHEEADRTKYDAIRESNENIRKQNESIRLANEVTRKEEELKRIEEENKRKLAEEERNANYNFMVDDEERRRSEANAHKEAEVLRVQAETNRVSEEAKRRTTEQARISAENTRVNSENTRKANEVTRKNNETQRIEAETQRQNRYNSFILDAEANANNFENYTNNAKVKEEERKSNELERIAYETSRKNNEAIRITNENTRKANENTRISNENTRQNVFSSKVNEVNTKILEVDKAKTDMTNTVFNKVNEIETRFNTLTSKQQQDAEVVDARDNEVSLKARLDRDIEKAKEIYVGVEGTYISTDSSVGYAKDVEILGNTVQDASNLADIRSVGDKVEGQELYEIPVVSIGKNLWIDSYTSEKSFGISGTPNSGYYTQDIKLKPNTNYTINISKGTIPSKGYYRVGIGNSASSSGGPQYPTYALSTKNTGSSDVVVVDKKATATTLEDGILRLSVWNGGYDDTGVRWLFDKIEGIQLEEGINPTPYEPYQEDKLTILSPTPLEKVGDVADRIICKDGVWGVEKNVIDEILDETKPWSYAQHLDKDNSVLFTIGGFSQAILNQDESCFTDLFINKDIFERDEEGCYISNSGNLYLRVSKEKAYNLSTFKSYLTTNNIKIKYAKSNNAFIPLPYDQQVKLRTFASKTNIHFETEIEGTIKAQVPKSLGATVNTHTEQIGNLSKELDRVKKLEESTVSTVTTESDFTTVEETSNGYFEDVKLEGRTLVNVHSSNPNDYTFNNNNSIVDGVITINANGTYSNAFDKLSSIVKPDTEYTIVLDIISNTLSSLNNGFVAISLNASSAFTEGYSVDSNIPIGRYVVKRTTKSDFTNINYLCRTFISQYVASGEIKFRIIVLEGDHTNNPPSYFEGLKSVGDGVDEVSVLSTENLADIATSGDDANFLIANLKAGHTYSMKLKRNDSSIGYNLMLVSKSDKLTVLERLVSDRYNDFNTFTPSFDGVLKFNGYANPMTVSEIMLVSGAKTETTMPNYKPYAPNKKPLLYYNPTTQTWEKPILRQWDSIEKHSDGKYYYHKRSEEIVLDSNIYTSQGIDTKENTIGFSLALPKTGIGKGSLSIICDKIEVTTSCYSSDVEGCYLNGNNVFISILRTKLSTQDVTGFKQWLQANPVTVVYQLAQEEVYECINIDLITYSGETNYIVNSGAISPKSTLKVHNNISNVVKILQEKLSLLESNVKASQEVQDMMILESDMRILDIELALMEHMPITLNLAENSMLRSATYFNFIKNHIVNETYSKEYLENVMNKYLATNRLTQEEYDELYKLLYPPVYDIELPIEY